MRIISFTLLFCHLLFNKSYGYVFDKSVPQKIKDQMINDMTFISSLKGNNQSPFHSQIFGTLNGENYKIFFESRIKAVGRSKCGDHRAIACVYTFAAKAMFITDNYIELNHPAIARLMVVFHEARHSEYSNGNWPHKKCPTPFLDENGAPYRSIFTGSDLSGAPACDSTPFGSYGSSAILLKNISKYCVNCNEKVKMDAGFYADDQLNRITEVKAKLEMINDIFDPRI